MKSERRGPGTLISAALLLVCLLPNTAEAGGSEASSSAQGRVINVSAAVSGSTGRNPPRTSGVPCEREGAVWETVVFDGVGGNGAATDPVTQTVNGTVLTKYITRCRVPGEAGVTQQTIYFAGPPSPSALVDAVFDEVPKYLNDPVVTWPNMSSEFGWLFVKVPMDFRVLNVAPITATASVNNSLGSASASVTATPVSLTFNSGDAGGTAQCDAEDGRRSYRPRFPGACSYTYVNSSSIAANGYSFAASLTVTWAISSVPANGRLPATLTTTTNMQLPVSEVQALVTCVGAGC